MKYLTFCNNGYYDLTKNMLLSAERCGMDMDDFYIACLDDVSLSKFSEYKNAFHYLFGENSEEFENWSLNSSSGFRKIVKNKWKIIKKIYHSHKNLCWVDSDIVFLKDPENLIKSKDKILFQSDFPDDKICSGFMVFNESDICQTIIEECSNSDEDDQKIINYVINNKYLNYIDILDEERFPNGENYFRLSKRKMAYIVHNNWIIGKEAKINRFRSYGMWFLDNFKYERF